MAEYDYLIVGAGLYGSVFAQKMKEAGKKCLVVDRRAHIGGNIYSEEIEGIQVHKYGPHIFHTDKEEVWEYVNRFARFNHFVYSPVANYKGELYNLPFNMNTFTKMWPDVHTPKEAEEKIKEQTREQAERLGDRKPRNLEEQAISLVGKDIYEKLIKGYTQKQWGRPCKELPAFIIRRLPVRLTFDNNYFNHPYQGIPIGGYTAMAGKMLEGTEARLGVDFLENRESLSSMANRIVYTGAVDAYYGYCFGALKYRSLRFENELLDVENYQGTAGMNYTDGETPYTRIIEHKHFEFGKGNHEKTVITKEYPAAWEKGMEPYYPVNDEENTALYQKYESLAALENNVVFGGRLGLYRYLDMDQVIAKALEDAEKELEYSEKRM